VEFKSLGDQPSELTTVDGWAAAAFFTSYEFLKGKLPVLFPRLGEEKLAPALHMLSASGGEVVRPQFLRSLPLLARAHFALSGLRTGGVFDSSTNRSGQAAESNRRQRNWELGGRQRRLGDDRTTRVLQRVRQHGSS
jgi:hypothetical protein